MDPENFQNTLKLGLFSDVYQGIEMEYRTKMD